VHPSRAAAGAAGVDPGDGRSGAARNALAERLARGVRSRCGLLLVGLTFACPAVPGVGQSPTTSRQELIRAWDLDRDGRVDEGEAEIARTRMRRIRNDALNSGADPLTGRPRSGADPLTGRPMPATSAATAGGRPSGVADEGDLILVPGTGEGPAPGGQRTEAGDRELPPRGSEHGRPTLPGTRVPAASATLPSVAPRLPGGPAAADAVGKPLQNPGLRQQPMPGQQPLRNPGVRPPQPPLQNLGARQPQGRGQPPAAGPQPSQSAGRPGVISGGVRAGAAAARPGYGAASGGAYGGNGPPADLNAGRLPARVANPNLNPLPPRPGVRQPQPSATVPRPPRMNTDEFYGR